MRLTYSRLGAPPELIVPAVVGVLLARDILNQYVLTANGPAGRFELALPA